MLNVGSDLLIGLSYGVISSVLAYIVYRNRTALPFDWVVLAFGLFIVACGLTHLMHVFVRYQPVYWFDGYVRGLTAIVSVATAAALPPLIPRISEIVNADRTLREHQVQLERANRALAASVARAEFLAGLGDALQVAGDPREVAELALARLGSVLEVDQIVATQVQGGRARLWSAWGQVHPTVLEMLSGDGSPLSATPMLRRVVETGQTQTTADYGKAPNAVPVIGPPVAAAMEPLRGAGGRVVGTLNFSRPAGQPWRPEELELTRRAAATISLALERTQSAQALRESEARLHEAMRHAPLGELVTGPGGRVERANPAAGRILGLEEGALLGLTLHEILGAAEWEEREEPGAGDRSDWTQRYVRPDGTALWLQCHTSMVQPSTVQTLAGQTSTVEAGGGAAAQTIVQLQDVTERHQAHLELQQLSVRLARSNRDLQEFASVASHDLQEPVRKVLAFGSRLQDSDGAGLSDRGRHSLERMQAAAERMQRLIGDLLEQALDDLDAQLARTGGEVERAPLPTVPGDPTQLRQLLQNLVGNALKYHRKDVPPRVRVSAAASAPGMVGLLVQDNGIGFAPEYAEKIFQPFQRLHGRDQYEGTGIGLAICRRIVERHGGTLTATGVEGEGSTFVLTLPTGEGGPASA